MNSHPPAEDLAPGTPSPRTARIPYPDGIRECEQGLYRFRFARTETDLEEVQRLRFEVFNRELGEGFEESWRTGRDADRFDQVCHHLMLLDGATGKLVGTYRMQVASMTAPGAGGAEGFGFYCAQEFDLSSLPAHVVADSIELGRACILKAHRNGLGLFTLWRGLAAYLLWSKKRFLFGCCSLTSQDPREGEAVLRQLQRDGNVSAELSVRPLPAFACGCEDVDGLPDTPIPRLFGTYLRYGAKACGPPAIDREFGTIDYFIVIDVDAVDERVRGMLFDGLEPDAEFQSGARG